MQKIMTGTLLYSAMNIFSRSGQAGELKLKMERHECNATA